MGDAFFVYIFLKYDACYLTDLWPYLYVGIFSPFFDNCFNTGISNTIFYILFKKMLVYIHSFFGYPLTVQKRDGDRNSLKGTVSFD